MEVAWAALRASLGLACLPQACLLVAIGLLLRPLPGLRPRLLLGSLLGVVAYAAVAMGDWGQAWPQLDTAAAALGHPLPWLAALTVALAVALDRAAEDSTPRLLLPIALLLAAALARPGHDPAVLSELRGGLQDSAEGGKIFLFQATQGLVLLMALLVGSLLSLRLVRASGVAAPRLQLAGRLLLGIWAAGLLFGLHGALSRLWILRWPLWLAGRG
jgi:hypothetical protein